MTFAVSHESGLRRLRRKNAAMRDAWTTGQMTAESNPFVRLALRSPGRMGHPFKSNSWVYRAVWVIANNLAAVPMRFVRGQGRTTEEVDAPAWRDLFKAPNPEMTRHEMWLHTWSNLLLPPGDVFLVLYGALGLIRAGETPREIWPWSGRYFQANTTSRGLLHSWTFTGGDHSAELLPHQVVQLKLFNPLDPRRGMSPVEAAALGVKTDYKAGVWNEAVLENGGEVGAYLKSPTELTDKQYRDLQRRWQQAHGGAGQKGKVAILESGLDYKRTGLSQTDMGYIDLKKWSRDEVAAVYGVPKFLMGVDDDANRSSSKELRRQFWLDTMIPLLSMAESTLEARLFTGRGGPELRGQFDLSGEESLQADEGARLDNAIKSRQLGVPLADIITTLGLGYPQRDLYEQSVIPMTFRPWDDLVEPVDDVDPGGRPPSDGTAEPAPINPDRAPLIITDRSTAAQREQMWRDYVRSVHGPGEKRFRKRIAGYFRGRRADTLRAIEDLGRSVRALDGDDIGRWLEEQRERWDRLVARQTRPVYQQIMEGSLDRLAQQLGGLDVADMEHPKVLEVLEGRVSQIKGVNDTLRTQIRDAVLDGLSNAENVSGIQDRIRHVFKVANSRSLTIARTETGSASMGARFEGYQLEGVTEHTWVTARDGEVRDTHLIDGETVPVGSPFSNGLLYPLDPAAPASEVANCRCDTIAE